MLRSLSVSNYILIGSLETTFPEGLSIITGETGAGKSILLGALSLVLGSRADASMVGPSADTCVVEAEFSLTPALEAVLREKDIPYDSEGIVLRRVVSRSGRSRSFIQDEPASLPELQELSAHLVDIHSQHQTLRLQDQGFRMDALDLYAGAMKERGECARLRTLVLEKRRLLEETRERLSRALRDSDYNAALLEKLEQARIVPGELAALEAEQEQLAHAEELKENLMSALSVLSADENSPSFLALQAKKALEKAGRYIPEMEALTGRLESARLELEDIAAEVETAFEKAEASPSRLQTVEERISLLYSLFRKHGVGSEEELAAIRDSLALEVHGTEGLEEDEKRLSKELSEASAAWEASALRLHALREKAAPGFAGSIRTQLRDLDLEKAEFSVSLAPGPDGPTGKDIVNFLFSSSGTKLQDVGKAASGGELSRIMLCLKASMARFSKMPTLVFDEIDTGVSGSTADKMGALICRMGADMQIVAITHLPQVAAKGSAHFLVSKEGGSTSMKLLNPQERIMEIARMLSGAVVSEAAVENAKNLLS